MRSQQLFLNINQLTRHHPSLRHRRDYIRVTGKRAVSVLPKVLKEGLLQAMDGDSHNDVDLYVQTNEKIEQALFKANSLSYEARRDYSSIRNVGENQKEKNISRHYLYSFTSQGCH